MAVNKAVIDPIPRADPIHPGGPLTRAHRPWPVRTRVSRRALEWRKHFSIFTGLAYKHLQQPWPPLSCRCRAPAPRHEPSLM